MSFWRNMSGVEILNLESTGPKPKLQISSAGKILVGLTGKIFQVFLWFYCIKVSPILGGVALGLTVICAPFVSPALRKFCLPYIPATNEQLVNILAALKGRKGTLLDLGSGDGRIVLGE